MKKLYLSFIALLCTLGAFAQSTVENINQPKAMKPIIMVVPEKAWCINQGFVKADDPNSPDYEKHYSITMYSMSSQKWAVSCKNEVIL